MKGANSILVMGFSLALLMSFIPTVHAQQIEANINPSEKTTKPEIQYLRTFQIRHPAGSELSNIFAGDTKTISVTVDSNTPGMQEIISNINKDLEKKGSFARVTGLTIDYNAQFTGREETSTLTIRIKAKPTIENYQRSVENTQTDFIDVAWRAMVLNGPAVVETEQYGRLNVNSGGGFFKHQYPEAYNIMLTGGASNILAKSIIDGTRLEKELRSWHFIFDPTGQQISADQFGFTGEKAIFSRYALGESSIAEGQLRAEKQKVQFGNNYQIETTSPKPQGTIELIGYAAISNVKGGSVLEVSQTPPRESKLGPGGGGSGGEDFMFGLSFPVFSLYGTAAAGAVGAIVVLFLHSRKVKQEEEAQAG